MLSFKDVGMLEGQVEGNPIKRTSNKPEGLPSYVEFLHFSEVLQ